MIAEPNSPGRPVGQQGPPIDYRDGLSPSLTNPQRTGITTIAQRRRQHPRRPGRDRSERLVAIRWNGWSRFAGMRSVDVRVIVTSTCAQ
jgi:hypothetical protein